MHESYNLDDVIENSDSDKLRQTAASLTWYHTIDLGGGIVTPGFYDHRPYLDYYGLPKDLHDRSTLDIGAASGFFTFELERRGAAVTATELPTWLAHDFGPLYRPDLDPEQAERYLHGPFEFAHETLGSHARRQLINIYDISPDTTGMFDLVFCGSVLLHLSDPVRALWRIQSVTREAAIIATVIDTYGCEMSSPATCTRSPCCGATSGAAISRPVTNWLETLPRTATESRSSRCAGSMRSGG